MQRFNRFPLAVFLKYVLIRFIAENDRSLVALVAGRTEVVLRVWLLRPTEFFGFDFFQNSPTTQRIF